MHEMHNEYYIRRKQERFIENLQHKRSKEAFSSKSYSKVTLEKKSSTRNTIKKHSSLKLYIQLRIFLGNWGKRSGLQSINFSSFRAFRFALTLRITIYMQRSISSYFVTLLFLILITSGKHVDCTFHHYDIKNMHKTVLLLYYYRSYLCMVDTVCFDYSHQFLFIKSFFCKFDCTKG